MSKTQTDTQETRHDFSNWRVAPEEPKSGVDPVYGWRDDPRECPGARADYVPSPLEIWEHMTKNAGPITTMVMAEGCHVGRVKIPEPVSPSAWGSDLSASPCSAHRNPISGALGLVAEDAIVHYAQLIATAYGVPASELVEVANDNS